MKNPVDYSELASISWDVIVVGGGPGGLIAARQCAKKGLKTLCIDRRQEIGSPVRCGEGLGEVWMRFAELEYDPSWCVQEMRGAVIYGPKKAKMVIPTANKGYVVERKIMEKKIAYQAIKAGAKLMLKAQVYDVIKEKGKVSGVRVESNNGYFDIHAKLVIAADGVDSQTARYAGVSTFNPVSEVDAGYEYEMTNCYFDHPDKIHIFVGNEIAPRGYVWIFPKSKDTANVGIGITGASDKNAKHYLDKWIASKPEIFKDASIVDIKGGCCPVGAPLKQLAYDGLMIVGDAGHMINAIHGGGMGTSMEAAMLAADVAEKAVKENKFDAAFLNKHYTDAWYEKRGNQLLNVLKVRHFFEKLTDDQMESLADIFTPETLLEFSDGKKLQVFAKAFAKQPKLMLLAAKTLLVG
ncbi:MAG: NAD(P)/FAD-dependent oxidoreductase [archaeon]